MSKHKHTTIDGREIVYTASSALAAFLDRVVALANDPRISEDEMIELVYSKENPLLDKTMFADRGAVTREVFDNPAYHVMLDWLGRKRQQEGRLDMKQVYAAATMSVTEAARKLGISTSAVRQAIYADRLAAVKKGRNYVLDPRDVENYHVGSHGPARTPALKVRVGKDGNKSLLLKAPGYLETSKDGAISTGEVQSFRTAAIKLGKDGHQVMLIIEPDDEERVRKLGKLYVRGKFRVVEEIEGDGNAANRFRFFFPERTARDRDHRKRELSRLATEMALDNDTIDYIKTRWDGDALSVHPAVGDSTKWQLDLRGWLSKGTSRTKAKQLKAALKRLGIDYGTRHLSKDVRQKRVFDEAQTVS